MRVDFNSQVYFKNNINITKKVSFKSGHDIDLFVKEKSPKQRVSQNNHGFISDLFAFRKLHKLFKKDGIYENNYQFNMVKTDTEQAVNANPVEALKKYEIIRKYSGFQSSKYLFIRTFLKDEKVSAEVVKDVLDLAPFVQKYYRPSAFFNLIKDYEDFNSQSTYINLQQDCIDDVKNFERDHFKLGVLNQIPEKSPLRNYSFIKDAEKYKSIDVIVDRLQSKMSNSYVDAIPVDNKFLENVDSALSFSNLSFVLKSSDLSQYSDGMILLTSRKYFISHFKNNIKNLSDEEKMQVYNYFNFYINKDDDIIHYPTLPKEKIKNASKEVEISVEKCKKLVNDYMYQNKVLLPQKDSKLCIFMNTIIKAFPEFIPQIEKQQHRGDTMDFHVLDNLKRIISNPEFITLKPNEQKILAYATLFHDFSKPENEIDSEHPFTSANYANDILKKINLSSDDKERIYNLIRYSHWLTDNNLDEQDIAVRFRRPNDFKMAQIFAKADAESAGFKYSPDTTKIDKIKLYLQKINENAIPLFSDMFPQNLKNYKVSQDGIKYIDFSDINEDVSKYGFKEGTKVKDLSFLFHSFGDLDSLDLISDITKEVCLSTTYLPFIEADAVKYNGAFNKVIVSVPNSNIALAGKNVSATGKKKNINDFADFVLKNEYKTDLFFRHEFSSYIKMKLGLSEYQYAQLYEAIGNLSSLDDIKHANLFNNKHLLKDEIIDAIKYAQNKIVYPIDKSEPYANEVDVINPKLEAFVLPKKFFLSKNKSNEDSEKLKTFEKIKEICLKKDIPVVLV